MRMRAHLTCAALMSVAASGMFVTDTAASTVYFGIPDGRVIAYARGASGWSRRANADLPDVGSYARPALADLDGDGDRDALVGEQSGRVLAYQNTGSDTAPVWLRQPSWDPGISFAHYAAPAVGKIDADSDGDLVVGASDGTVRVLENIGNAHAPAWRERAEWQLQGLGSNAAPALADIDGDGRTDLLVGTNSGAVLAYAATTGGAAVFTRRAAWDPPIVGQRVAVALGDLDGDHRPDLLIVEGNAISFVFRNAGGTWTAMQAASPPDPGSGPAGAALIDATVGAGAPPSASGSTPTPVSGTSGSAPTPAPGGSSSPVAAPTPVVNAAPVARLSASSVAGPPPLSVRLDASASRDPEGTTLSFTWDFGDGTIPAGQPPEDPGAAIRDAIEDYGSARAARDGGDFVEAVAFYLADVDALLPLTEVAESGPVKAHGTTRIDRVARWYLQKIGHELGGIYLFHSVGLGTCERYATSLQYSRESAAQARAGGFPKLPSLNGTNENIAAATQALQTAGCAVPAPAPAFPPAPTAPGPLVTHVYDTSGTYVARVTVSDGKQRTTATVTIVAGSGTPPTPAPPPFGGGDADSDPLEGFGTSTRGGEGGRQIHVTAPTEAALRAAFRAAASGGAVVVFDVPGPITVTGPLPALTGAFITIEGNGAMLVGNGIAIAAPILEVNGHDVIVRNLRVRNGGDNFRVQGDGAYDVVLSHVSSTGASDDGISIGYGAHDVTVQWSFLAGNTRSLFLKYGAATHISIHHTWVMKQWVRGPLVSGAILADLRNLIVEDWTMWGARFEADSRGNLVNSLFTLGAYARSIGGKPGSPLRLIQSGPVFTAGNVYESLAEDGPNGNATAPIDAPPVTTLPVAEMAPLVRARAGTLPRDAVDRAYITATNGWRVGKETPLRLTAP